MSKDVTIRCASCGKVLKGKPQEDHLTGNCPRCHGTVRISVPLARECRKFHRAIVGENQFVTSVPQPYGTSKTQPLCRVMYTEVPPADFILYRSSHVPLLDLSEGGMGLFVRADNTSKELLPGSTFVTEIDFPILVQPVFVMVEVRWVRPIKEDKIMQLGVRFCNMDDALKSVLLNLKKYIESRTKELEFEKWGAFA
jgi:phage FluMu protein Com